MQNINAEIIAIGDEILIGQIVDTNSSWICKEMNQIGININHINAISDNKKAILDALSLAASRAKIVLITGGLGPTNDDITKPTLCEFFDTILVLNQEVLKNVERLIIPRFGSMNDLNRQQAMTPRNCTVINNPVGTAPILWFEKNNVVYVAMPGVPHEMQHAMNNEIIPRLKTKFDTPTIFHKTVLTTGIGESFLAEKIAPWERQLPDDIQLAYLPAPGCVRLRLSCCGKTNTNEIISKIDAEIDKLKTYLPTEIYGFDTDTLEMAVGKLLTEKNKTLATAESCTGGNIAHMITSVSGASAYFKGTVVAYANEIKEKILGVDKNDIEMHGAVSQQVVIAMAQGVRKLMATDLAVATSGVAGPDGGTPNKPVGTVWIAIAYNETTTAQVFNFGNDRLLNINKASAAALDMIRRCLIQNNTD